MLVAAYHCFCERGYTATTMDAIAEAAGVAVQTLYFTFRTKAAILSEVLGAAVVGFERWQGPLPANLDAGDSEELREGHDWYTAFEQELDAARALRLFVDRALEPLTRTAPLVAALHAAAAEPEVRAVVELGERRRAESWAAIVKQLARKQRGLRPGLSPRRASDVLFVVFSNATLLALRERGWSDAECRRWFVETLEHQLLGADAG